MSFHYTKIFTFINFANIIPPYINLCIKTWKQHLPKNCQIIILTPDNIADYIDKQLLTESVLNPHNSHAPVFSDYIGCLVLYCNGGIFLDADTIITDSFKHNFNALKHYDTVFFRQHNKIIQGFIMSKRHSCLLEELILHYRFEYYLPEIRKNRNIPLNSIVKNSLLKNFLLIDNMFWSYKLEYMFSDDLSNTAKRYRDYYFGTKYSVESFLKNNNGIAALNNSVTPARYKKMSESEFLRQDILLSKIFRVLL